MQLAEWKYRGGSFSSAAALLTARTGMTLEELTAPAMVPADQIENIPAAAELLRESIRENMPVVVVGDYDADGICGTAILVLLLRALGCQSRTIIPRRMTDGYGICDSLLAGISHSLILCVDNGIAAAPQLKAAKEADNRVIILDHHLLSGEAPPADVIVDPHLSPEKNAFEDYCGGGLALKLAEYMLPRDAAHRPLFYGITALAAIATIADVMPLVGDNRRIVKEGLQIMNHKRAFTMLPMGLQAILLQCEAPYDEETIKFTVGPMLNAPGRLYDAGSSSTLKAVLCAAREESASYAARISSLNDERKNAVSSFRAKFENMADPEKPIQVLYAPGVPEGILGIIAGKVSESLKMPALLITDAKEPGILKASGRSYGSFHFFDAVETIRHLTTTAGGHAGAAGLSFPAENLDTLKSLLEEYAAAHPCGEEAEDVIYYDIALQQQEAAAFYQELRELGPLGEGCPAPVVLLKDFCPYSHRFMSGGVHLKLSGPSLDVVAFSMAEQFRAMGSPGYVDVIGTLGVNRYRGKTTLQLQALDLRPSESDL